MARRASVSVSAPRGLSRVSRARPRSPRVRARWRPWRGSRWRVAGAICRPGAVGWMVSPPNSAQASTAAGKTWWRWPAGEAWSRRASAQISACLMSQRPGCQPAVRRAASTGVGKRGAGAPGSVGVVGRGAGARSVCICRSFVGDGGSGPVGGVVGCRVPGVVGRAGCGGGGGGGWGGRGLGGGGGRGGGGGGGGAWALCGGGGGAGGGGGGGGGAGCRGGWGGRAGGSVAGGAGVDYAD